MSCWPHRRGKSRSGKDRRRNQEKCQGALLTVVGTWRKRRAHDAVREPRVLGEGHVVVIGKGFRAHLVAL